MGVAKQNIRPRFKAADQPKMMLIYDEACEVCFTTENDIRPYKKVTERYSLKGSQWYKDLSYNKTETQRAKVTVTFPRWARLDGNPVQTYQEYVRVVYMLTADWELLKSRLGAYTPSKGSNPTVPDLPGTYED